MRRQAPKKPSLVDVALGDGTLLWLDHDGSMRWSPGKDPLPAIKEAIQFLQDCDKAIFISQSGPLIARLREERAAYTWRLWDQNINGEAGTEWQK